MTWLVESRREVPLRRRKRDRPEKAYHHGDRAAMTVAPTHPHSRSQTRRQDSSGWDNRLVQCALKHWAIDCAPPSVRLGLEDGRAMSLSLSWATYVELEPDSYRVLIPPGMEPIYKFAAPVCFAIAITAA